MPSTAQTRRDPQQGKKGFSKYKGFTVIELMIAVAVIAIITSLALPSYRALIEKRQLTSSTLQVAAFLSAAKIEAVKRNQNIRLASDVSDGWCLGFASYAPNADPDAVCDCSITDPDAPGACTVGNLDDSARELRIISGSSFDNHADLADITLGAGPGDVVTFDPLRGMLLVDNAVLAVPVEVKLTSKYGTYALNVRALPTGRVTVCNDHVARPGAESPVPGYDDC